MAQFYFDTDDGTSVVQDDEGLDCASMQAAREMVLAALPDMVRQGLRPDGPRTFSARVRDESGATVYSAGLRLEEEWSVEQPTS